MIVFDTNIISELFKPQPDLRLLDWVKRNQKEVPRLTSVTVAEMCYGLSLMNEGKRKAKLAEEIAYITEQKFAGKILNFGCKAAKRYGALAAQLKVEGIVIGQNDAMIASIVAEHKATLLTRNDKHFVHCGINVVNPF